MIFKIQAIRCVECGEFLNGRRDKRFCDDRCRVRHFRKFNQPSPLMKRIDRVLTQNRDLLKSMKSTTKHLECAKSRFEWLRRKGFDFNFHTHVQPIGDGRLAIMCYEEGYVIHDDGLTPWSESSERQLSLLSS